MNIIKQKRIEAGLTQFELSWLVGVSQQAVVNWENGSSKPRPRNFPKIAIALNTTVGNLLEGYNQSEQ